MTDKTAHTPRPRIAPQPWLLATWAIVMFIFLYTPIIVVIVMSFNDSTILALPLKGFTLDWYREVFADEGLQAGFVNSLKVALWATVLSSVFALFAAFAIHRYRFFGRQAFRVAVNLPILLPGVVTGVAMLAAFSSLQIEAGLLTVLLGHAVFGLPVAMGAILTRLSRLPRNLEEAGYDLGARPIQVLTMIVWPYLRSAVISGALLAFTLSFDEVVVTIFLTGRENTLPMEIWARLRTEITPEIAAAASLVLVFSTVLVLLNQYLQRFDQA
jgi:spermidine/putrescine transport system permease protein